MRIVLCRGGLCRAEPLSRICRSRCVLETFDGYMTDIEQLVKRYHRPLTPGSCGGGDGATIPCCILPGRPAAGDGQAGSSLGIQLHSHLSETVDYLDAARERFAIDAVQFCAGHDWLGNDVVVLLIWWKLLPEDRCCRANRHRHRPLSAKATGGLGSRIADLLALERPGAGIAGRGRRRLQ